MTNKARRMGTALRSEVAVDPVAFRNVLGHFCTGLTIVTARGPHGPVGFTCQSFMSLSLKPPLITISAAKSSTTWPQIREAGRFCVNVLSHEHQGISDAFARSGADKFAGVEWKPSPNDSPMLSGVIAWIDCEIVAEYDGGDHSIVVGSVQDLAVRASATPLLFYRGEYIRPAC